MRRDRPVHVERYRFRLAASSKSFASASFSAAFRYPDVQGLAAQSNGILSLRVSRPTALMGFLALRRFAPASGWSRHFCRAGPTSFVLPRSPRFIFVGVIAPLLV
jgi:hypothetical protein